MQTIEYRDAFTLFIVHQNLNIIKIKAFDKFYKLGSRQMTFFS